MTCASCATGTEQARRAEHPASYTPTGKAELISRRSIDVTQLVAAVATAGYTTAAPPLPVPCR